MKKEITPDLIRKFLENRCTPEENLFVQEWYDSFENEPGNSVMLSAEEQQHLKEDMRQKISQKIMMREDDESRGIKKLRSWTNLIYPLAGIAASILVVFALFYSPSEKTPGATYSRYVALTVVNSSGSIRKQALPDGSTIWLCPGTKIEYPAKFEGKTRPVKMAGEAFFEVRKDKTRPFIIHSGGIITRVHGTSFRIRAYANQQTQVAVVSGKVSVRIPDIEDSEVMLEKDQEAVFVAAKRTLKKADIERNSSLKMWKKTDLTFEDTPVRDVMSELNKRFNVAIRTEDPALKQQVLSADFTDLTLPAILSLIEKSLNVTYTIHDSLINLRSNTTNSQTR